MSILNFNKEFYNNLFNTDCFNQTNLLEEYIIIEKIDKELNNVRNDLSVKIKGELANVPMARIEEIAIKYKFKNFIKINKVSKNPLEKKFCELICIFWVKLLFVNELLAEFSSVDRSFLHCDISRMVSNQSVGLTNELLRNEQIVTMLNIDKSSKIANSFIVFQNRPIYVDQLTDIICQQIVQRFIIEGDLQLDALICITNEELNSFQKLLKKQQYYFSNYVILRNVDIDGEFDTTKRKLKEIKNPSLFNFFYENKDLGSPIYFYCRKHTYKVNDVNNKFADFSREEFINEERALSEILFSLIIELGSIRNSFFQRKFYMTNSVSLPFQLRINSFDDTQITHPGDSKLLLSQNVLKACDSDNKRIAIILSRLKICVFSNNLESRIINIVTLWETLLGVNEDINFKISLCIAKIMSKSNDKTLRDNNRIVKNIYNIRSKILHGSMDVLLEYKKLSDVVDEAEEITYKILNFIYKSGYIEKSSKYIFEKIIFEETENNNNDKK